MTHPGEAAHLLSVLAGALNACDRAGLKVKLRHGIVQTREGYIVPLDVGWVPSTRAYTEFSPEGDDDED